jgi:GNAT superfamily N-acetyltransferase
VSKPSIAPPDPSEKAGWRHLYNGYAEFYKVPMDDRIADTVWGWLHDPAHVLTGLLARDEAGKPIGLAHFREMPRPLAGRVGGFLDDLYVEPSHRGTGIADALIEAMVAHARDHEWANIRWMTAENNYRGRGLYDRIAQKTHWLTYEIKL